MIRLIMRLFLGVAYMMEKRFLKEAMNISIPAALQSMLQSSFSMIDQVMVGQLRDQSVAAVEIASRPGFIYDFLVSAISTIAAIMTSQYIGKNNREAKEKISSASMWNMDGMAVMGICEDAYQKLLCHRTRDFLDRCWI